MWRRMTRRMISLSRLPRGPTGAPPSGTEPTKPPSTLLSVAVSLPKIEGGGAPPSGARALTSAGDAWPPRAMERTAAAAALPANPRNLPRSLEGADRRPSVRVLDAHLAHVLAYERGHRFVLEEDVGLEVLSQTLAQHDHVLVRRDRVAVHRVEQQIEALLRGIGALKQQRPLLALVL